MGKEQTSKAHQTERVPVMLLRVIHSRLKNYCDENGLKIKSIVDRAISEWLDKEEKKKR